jgi:FAD/FMN-containing dehydrogenase
VRRKVFNWGRYPQEEIELFPVHYLEDLDKLVSRPCIARGNGRCYGDSSLSSQVISMVTFDKALLFDQNQGIFKCQSGMLLSDILDIIVPHGWFLPVTPGTKFITVGGAVASDIHGKNHHLEGSFSKHIVEFEIYCGKGMHYRCSPQEHQDLFYATCGGMGLTGIITSVTFQLKKIESVFITRVQEKAKNLDEAFLLFEKYRNHTYSMAWIDCLKGGNSFGRSIIMAGEHTELSELNEKKRPNALSILPSAKLNIPFDLPSFILNELSVKSFNQFYYHKIWNKIKYDIIYYDPFFYPLDAINNWNRMYGKDGFIQYQFVLPLNTSRAGLIEIMGKIREQGSGSFLAVLKQFGPQDGVLSFPMEGYTLALDFPLRPGLLKFLNKLDELVLKYSGRLYLTKDARMEASVFKASYPNLVEFTDVLEKYAPNRFFSSFQSQRLF